MKVQEWCKDFARFCPFLSVLVVWRDLDLNSETDKKKGTARG